MIKVYKKGNYIKIEDTFTNRQYQGTCKDVRIFEDYVNSQVYYFFGLINNEGLKGIPLSQIIKQDNSNYTLNEWETFYTDNTGNFNSGAVLAPQILDALNNSTSPSSSNPFLTNQDQRVKNVISLNYNSSNSTIELQFIDQDGITQTLTTSFSNLGIKYNVLNYSELLTVTPSPVLYDFAYVRQSQGISWLPGSIGGTYYNKGLYMFDGTNWIEDDTDILQVINTLVGQVHTHSNISILNSITEAFTTSLKSLYDSAEVSITNLLTTGQRLITTSEINKLLNTTNVNSGDETTLSIQTKRPLKTINGVSIEGSGNATISALYTETDPIVSAINGIVKSNGSIISAAVAGTDYVLPNGNITGTASNIIATSNSTITTLSALILPQSQVTGLSTSLTNKEDVANKQNNLTTDVTNTKYPTVTAVNTGFATWTGSTNITTLGTITTGTWSGTTIADNKIASALTGKTYNALSLSALATGFNISGGTTSKTLTVNNTLGLSGTDNSTLNIGSGGTLGSAAFTNTSSYEVPLTFSTGLTRSTNTITVNSSQNITTLSNLTTNGYVKTSGGVGILSVSSTIPNTDITGLGALATLSSVNLSTQATGTLQVGQMPALTGDVTNTAGSLATTVSRINGIALSGLATGLLKNTTTTGVPSIAIAGTDYAPATSGTSILKGNGAGGFSNAIAGTDYANASHTHTLSNVSDVTMTVVNLNSLDDGVNSTLHFHDSDRNRANHTGTQTASTISDFNTASDARISNAVINALSDVVITSPTANQVLKYNGTNWVNGTDDTSAGGGGVSSITGTINQVNASASTGAVTLSLPQDIATSSSPTFNILNATKLNVGTLGYSDTGILASLQSSINSYNQLVIQNTNAGASASSNFIVGNDLTTSTTHFAEFGKNSSGFTGSGAFNSPNTSYISSTSDDLAIGTTTANSIRFIVNGGTTDAITINSNGSVAFNGQVGTIGQVLQSNGTSAPTWVTPSSGGLTFQQVLRISRINN